jgi:hypothetical protein
MFGVEGMPMSDQADGLRRMVRSRAGGEGLSSVVEKPPPSDAPPRVQATGWGMFAALAARWSRHESAARSRKLDRADYSV